MIRKLISAQPRKLWFLLGCATLFFGIFVKVTQELLEGTSGDPKMKWLDEFVLLEVSKLRVDWLNGPAVDITAPLRLPLFISLLPSWAAVISDALANALYSLH